MKNKRSLECSSFAGEEDANADAEGGKNNLRVIDTPGHECFWFYFLAVSVGMLVLILILLPLHLIEEVVDIDVVIPFIMASMKNELVLLVPLFFDEFVGLYYFVVALFVVGVVGLAIGMIFF